MLGEHIWDGNRASALNLLDGPGVRKGTVEGRRRLVRDQWSEVVDGAQATLDRKRLYDRIVQRQFARIHEFVVEIRRSRHCIGRRVSGDSEVMRESKTPEEVAVVVVVMVKGGRSS